MIVMFETGNTSPGIKPCALNEFLLSSLEKIATSAGFKHETAEPTFAVCIGFHFGVILTRWRCKINNNKTDKTKQNILFHANFFCN